MRRTVPPRIVSGRVLGAYLAAGLVGLAVPVPAAQAEPAFGGYSADATATPLRVEVYEPVVPIPDEPQAEAVLAYTKVEAASGPTGRGLASWMWPGDPVGEGCKTFVEQLQLQDTGLCKDGYPVQVNSETPGGPSSAADEQFPGSVMRTSADAKGVRASAGWSTDGDIARQPGGGDQPAPPGPPGPPAPPAPPADSMSALGTAITGKQRSSADEEPPGHGLPPELAAVVDVDGMASSSSAETTARGVRTVATSELGELSLLGGIITADSIHVTSTTTADGRAPTADGASKVVGLELGGTPITVTSNGVQLVDQKSDIPGLPDEPEKALAQLGVSLQLPKPEQQAGGDTGLAAFQGLQIVIDTRPLRSNLDDIPFDDLIGAMPDGEGISELKSLLGAATQLAPTFVITAGDTMSETTTVDALNFDLGSLPSIDPGARNGAAAPPSAGGAAGSADTGAPAVAATPAGAGDVGALAADPASSSGLPPLGSVPGALMAGGFVIATAVGWWLQKMGGLVLGGAGACSHGLETGVPDLRRA